ncbi:MAG TPA: 2-alkenal reductase, partial [Alcanivorax sp.]|nr:2-alkenal reductase [Alcanivorax sp.]
RAAPAVVNVYTTQIVTRGGEQLSDDPLFNRFMERPRRERALASLGSGVLVSSEGYVLTSYHVIRDADEILVALRDGRDAPARVVGTDPETDLALLQIALEDLPQIELNGPQPVSVGDVVLAIGNPLGVGQTVSMGIVSATGRT